MTALLIVDYMRFWCACGAIHLDFRDSSAIAILSLYSQPRSAALTLQVTFYSVGGPKLTLPEDLKSRGSLYLATDSNPKLIPKIFHQTYMTTDVPPAIQPLMQSWRLQNPDWNFRFYDDEACLEFVAQQFPEYLEAYKGLPKNVERSDFFRCAQEDN